MKALDEAGFGDLAKTTAVVVTEKTWRRDLSSTSASCHEPPMTAKFKIETSNPLL